MLAEEIGYPDSVLVDTLVSGSAHISFRELDDFCSRAALHPPWLKHGKDNPFEVSRAGLRGSNRALIEQLEKSPADTRLYFVRSDCENADMCVVLRSNRYAWKVLESIVRITSELGAGGRIALFNLYRLIEQIRETRHYTRVFGYTLASSDFAQLMSGTVFPGTVLSGKPYCRWWDDFTDIYPKYPIAEEYPRYNAQFVGAQSTVRLMLEEIGKDSRD